jgi:hypothetical protein
MYVASTWRYITLRTPTNTRNSTSLPVTYTCLTNGEMACLLLLLLKRQGMKGNFYKSPCPVFVIFVPFQKNLHFVFESEQTFSL